MRYVIVIVLLLSLTGCSSDEAFWTPAGVYSARTKKAQTEFWEARAKIAQYYQQCLEKYREDPIKAKEVCVIYNEALIQLDVRGMK